MVALLSYCYAAAMTEALWQLATPMAIVRGGILGEQAESIIIMISVAITSVICAKILNF